MKNIFEQLTDLLKKDERLVSQDGILLKNQTQELARKNDPVLIKLLLSDKAIKQHFFFEVEKTLIFDKEKFVRFISNKQFLPDSYTSFKNKTGLTAGDEYLSESKEVVLAWPYKNCVLEGGMTKEDQKRDEIFYNETLAPDDINRLLDAKVFTNFKRINKKGEHKLDSFRRDEKGTIKDNLIIKGNNLLALASLKKEFAGKVKLIYIDPPYNTGNDGFNYNDNFNQSTWLVFMKTRLEMSWDLLKSDGSIYVQIDTKESHYLKVLMDEIFGKNNFRSQIIWDTSIPYVAGNKWLSKNWIYSQSTIFYYAKQKINVFFNKLTFEVKQPSGDISNKPYKDVWTDIKNFSGFLGARDLKIDFNTRKPEHLIKRILLASSNPNDIVLDYHIGSGTTCAVAHKMGRQYIGVEQMEYVDGIVISRLKDVIMGEKEGISKEENWKGGGDFVYMELAKWNEEWIEKIRKAKTGKELAKLWGAMKETAFLSYKVDPKTVDASTKDFAGLSTANQKKFLIECLDKNQLYVNLSEIEDKEYEVSKEDKALNKNFYNAKQ